MRRFIQITLGFLILTVLNGSTLLAQDTAPDETPPSDVENVRVTPENKSVKLEWDPATDNMGVTGYKIHHGTETVQQDNRSYNGTPISIGTVTEYIFENLENGKAHYFAVTALDSAENESVKYSVEVSATPKTDLKGSSVEDDGEPPAIKEVVPVDDKMIKIFFSEPIILPLESAESAFQIKKKTDNSSIAVTLVELDPNDAEGNTVILATSAQAPDETYIVTVGIEVQDHYENAVTPGEGDSKEFVAKGAESETDDAEDAEPAEDKTAPTVKNIKSKDGTKFEIEFDEPVVLAEDKKSHFTIYRRQSAEDKKAKKEKDGVEVKNVTLSKDSKTVFFQTEAQDDIEYVVVIEKINDVAGNEYVFKSDPDEGQKEEGIVVVGTESSLLDLVPPEDVTSLIAKLKAGSTNIVALKWTASKDGAGDLNDQLLYIDDSDAKSLGKTGTATDVSNLTPGKRYSFKITTKDKTGNESEGTLVVFRLPETGPEVFALGITALFAGWYRRREKRS
ncbi:MAG: hypothetical protein UY05_C0050G0003 [Candidatus Peregrinibacteria bacterium GW2011_GWA2_47_7]|nr:MAG: hypothetical protein UY05_C0050G0003 [Candidatus Peregrinibacteria bacterium GW2011_GWA2_47_7]